MKVILSLKKYCKMFIGSSPKLSLLSSITWWRSGGCGGGSEDDDGDDENISSYHLFFLIFGCSITVIAIFPHYSPLPCLPHLPHSIFPLSTLHSPPFRCPCPWVFYTCSLTWLFPYCPPLSPSPSPSGNYQFVLYFHVYGSILLACLFILLIRFHL